MNFKNLEKFMDSLTDWVIPGNSVSVYKDNEEVFRYSSGFADIESKTKMRGDELMYIYASGRVSVSELYEILLDFQISSEKCT